MTPAGFEQFAVGQIFTSAPQEVTAEEIKAFAAQYDFQAQHLDEAKARGTMFGELVASGWHTAAITMRLMLQSAMGGVAGRSLGIKMDGLAWPKPVRPGDQLRARSEVVELRPSRSRPDRGIAVIRTDTLNERDEVVQTMTGTIMVLRSDAVLG